MLLSVREAATLLRCSPRAVRARLVRNDLKGSKVDGRWLVARDALPLTAEEHHAVQERAGAIRDLVENVLPPRLPPGPDGRPRRTLADLAAFRAGVDVHRRLRAAESGVASAAAGHVEAALVALGRAWPLFHPDARVRLLDEARSHVGAAMATLLLDGGPDAAALVVALESQMLPPLAGMCRAAERREDRARA